MKQVFPFQQFMIQWGMALCQQIRCVSLNHPSIHVQHLKVHCVPMTLDLFESCWSLLLGTPPFSAWCAFNAQLKCYFSGWLFQAKRPPANWLGLLVFLNRLVVPLLPSYLSHYMITIWVFSQSGVHLRRAATVQLTTLCFPTKTAPHTCMLAKTVI